MYSRSKPFTVPTQWVDGDVLQAAKIRRVATMTLIWAVCALLAVETDKDVA